MGNLHSPSGLTPNQKSLAKAANHLEIKLKRKVAEAQGFEPWVRSHVRRFSKPVHSTTLPNLRVWTV